MKPTLIIVQSRMSSERLPGKVLVNVNGHPMLWYTIKRLSQCSAAAKIVVATSSEKNDEPIVKFCKENSISIYRGDLNNVTLRLLSCAIQYKAKYFVRISGDSPLIDPILVDVAIQLHRTNQPDLTTNVLYRTFPKGQSVEVINTDILAQSINKFSCKSHFEHVTKYFYENSKKYQISNFSSGFQYSKLQMSVDNNSDLIKLKDFICESKLMVDWKNMLKKISTND
jgi:spore coat polysaccharide biosynthesis protein SpsF